MVTIPLASGAVSAEIVRHAPAARRVRLNLAGLRNDPALARRVEAHFAAAGWVVEVQASLASGRVLLCYDADTVFSAELLERAPGAGWTRWSPPDAAGPTGREVAPGEGAPSGGTLAARVLRAVGLERWLESPAAPRPVEQATARWHSLSVEEALGVLASGQEGLADAEARARLVHYGANQLEAQAQRTRLEILASQFANLPTMLLLVSGTVSVLLGDVLDAGVIVLVVVLNAAVGYHIERRNEALLSSWRRLEAGTAQVIRGATVATVAATDLVPGDVVLLRAGDVVPADARVIDAHRLACDEAALTGESEAQAKRADPVADGAALADRRSMMYAGTVVVGGRGRAVVVATGRSTELAGVRTLIEKSQDPQTPLERRLSQLGRWATGLGVGAAGVMAVGGLLRGRPAVAVGRTAVALGVAAIPEGLPVVATAALVHCMERMRGDGMVVRRLVSAETLGGVTVVCVDKTGTLTRNEMQLEVLESDAESLPPDLALERPREIFADRRALALAAGVLNSDIDFHSNGNGLEISGSATERALVAAAQRAGLNPEELRERLPRRALRERKSAIHYVLSLHDGPEGPVAFVKGAPEQVLDLCDRDVHGPLDQARRRQLLERNEALAESGHRVLAIAWKRLGADEHEPHEGFDFLALAGLRDPLRPGSAEAVATAARAGIRTLVLTGDQRATAAAVAREVGIAGLAVDGGELARRLEAGDRDAEAELDGIAVLSRVSPADKVAIVRALRRRGEVVAMAGDGINDAPALKVADVGIAVGAHASDIARQTADVVLETADLRSILAAVGEGRIVQDNLRRSVRFLFASNLSEVALMLGGMAAGQDPLQALQLLWINLLGDTLPALALAFEPGDPEVLGRGPAPPGSPLLQRRDWDAVVRDGALLGLLGGAAFLVGGTPAAFATLVGSQIGYAFACRAPEKRVGPRFVALVGSAAVLQLGAMLLPPFRAALKLPAPSLLPFAGLAIGVAAAPAVRALADAASRLSHRPPQQLWPKGRIA
jgi:Ca2+-transporting ATPase